MRVGNAAWRQKQLDVLGHVLDCAWVLRDALGTPDGFTRAFLCQLADRAARQWRETDSSIWEGREGERHYVVSKLYCWVALDRAVRLHGAIGGDRARWAAERDALRDVLLRDAWHPERGAYTGAFGSDHLDAGVLLMPLVGLLDAADPRMRRTVAALEDELGDDGLLRRWTGAEDGPFLLASFWLSRVPRPPRASSTARTRSSPARPARPTPSGCSPRRPARRATSRSSSPTSASSTPPRR